MAEMQRFLTVTTPADQEDGILTMAQMRSLAGVTGESQDDALRARGMAVTANIMTECKIAVGSGADPTLRQETLTETFYCVKIWQLPLARRHNVIITSITVDGTLLSASDYLVDRESGLLTRLSSDWPIGWCAGKIVVIYKAGFADDLPNDLIQAASDYFRAMTNEQTRDPYVKSESVELPGLETLRTDLWTGDLPGGGASCIVPPSVAAQLTRYRNMVVV